MFRSDADDSGARGVRAAAVRFGFGLAFHLAAALALLGQAWLAALFASFSGAAEPPVPQTREVVTMLAPPPGEFTRTAAMKMPSARRAVAAGAAVKIDEGAAIAFDADDARQLVPVLTAFDGLIAFVPLLDRLHPRAAYRLDGSRVATPKTLDGWTRIRLANPSWWPEIDALCEAADAAGEMEAVAVFPPAYRLKLDAAIGARMAEMKSSGRVVAVGLRLEAGRPAGVDVRAIRLAAGTS